MSSISRWFQEKLLDPLKTLPWSGRASALFSGAWFGIFPVPGVSTFLLLFAIQFLKMRQLPFSPPQVTIALAVNLLATPLMFAMIPMWLSAGSGLFNMQGCDASDIIPAFKQSVVTAVTQFTGCLVAAMLAWSLATPVALGPLFLVHKKNIDQANSRSDRVPLIRFASGGSASEQAHSF
jgi:hypothetical protein